MIQPKQVQLTYLGGKTINVSPTNVEDIEFLKRHNAKIIIPHGIRNN